MNKKIFAANWKMYLDSEESKQFMLQVNSNKDFFSDFNIMIFPSHLSLEAIQVLAKDFSNIRVGMQDCDILTSGAVTGSNSVTSLKIDSCIVGHSERRTIFKEDNELIEKKLNICLDNINSVVLCIGENLKQKEQNQILSFFSINSLSSLKIVLLSECPTIQESILSDVTEFDPVTAPEVKISQSCIPTLILEKSFAKTWIASSDK
jgi:triosephosphate isomerase